MRRASKHFHYNIGRQNRKCTTCYNICRYILPGSRSMCEAPVQYPFLVLK